MSNTMEVNEKLGAALTEKENQVSYWLCLGKSRMEIAETMCLSPNTVRNHIASICQKLGAYSSPEVTSTIIDNKLQDQFNISLAELLA